MATRVKSAPRGVSEASALLPRQIMAPLPEQATGPVERRSVPSRTAAGDRARRRRAGRGPTPPNRTDAERPGAERPGADGRVGPRSGATTLTPRRTVVSAGQACPRPEQPYRMGRWARLATTATVLVVGVLAGWSVLAGGAPVVQDVVVQSGDTLRSIAASAQPGTEVDAVVLQILELNTLAGQEPLPGQILQVPVQG